MSILGASVFGDLFLLRSTGEVDMLDLVAGEVKQIAACVEEFEWDVTQREKREEWLMPSLANAAFAIGLKPGPGECLAFRTPPFLNGPLQPGNLYCLDFVAYQVGMGKILPQVLGLPPGTQIVSLPPSA